MEYELVELPQAGEDDSYELFEARYARHAPTPQGRSDAHDRAVAIPEQEAGS